MNSERFARLREIYGRLSEVPPEQRGPLIQEWCEGDAELRAELDALLAADVEGDPAFLEPPTVQMPIPAEDEQVEIPKQLGDYDLIRALGEGGMGYVYLARQRSLDRLVALKLLPSRPGLQQKEVDRFLREAQSAAKLRHPRIVRIHDIDSIDNIHFFAMDLVEGRDLGTEIQSLRREREHSGQKVDHYLPRYKSPEYFPTIVRIVASIADALSHAHQNGIVHRDIKPQNILLNDRLEPFLVDFGLARDGHLTHITMSGDLVGSPAYMSPEQVIGRRSRIDHRTDVYSLGIVLYELLTLKRPFEGRTSREVLNHVLEREPVPVRRSNPRVPVDLETICMTAISRSPDDRYDSVRAFAVDCEHFLNHEAIEARPPSVFRRASIFLRRNRSEAWITVGAMLAVILAIVFTVHRTRAARVADELASLERQVRVLDDPNGAASESQILEAARQYAIVASLEQELDPSQGARLESAERALRDRFEGNLKDVLETISSAGTVSDRWQELAAALDRMMRIAAISNVAFTDRTPTASMLVSPSVDVIAVDADGKPIAASVHLCEFDPVTGNYRKDASPTIAGETRRAPKAGYYRIIVVDGSGRFLEFGRWLEAWKRCEIRARFSPDSPVPDPKMVKFEGGDLRMQKKNDYCIYRGAVVRVEPFDLDPHEVSVGEYLEYCRKFDVPLPQFYRERSNSELKALENRPVSMLRYSEMLGYAEAMGKRLPTHFELELAIRGVGDPPRPYPWGNADPEDVDAHFNFHPADLPEGTSKFEDILRGTANVEDGLASRSPEGVFFLQGNVCELTETPGTDFGDGTNVELARTMIRREYVVAVGGSYRKVWPANGATPHSRFEPDNEDVFLYRDFGFRCARSAKIVGD